MALLGAPRGGARRPGRQRGRRGGVRARRPALLHALRRREGRLPLPPARSRHGGTRARCPALGDNALLKLAPVLARCPSSRRSSRRRRGSGSSRWCSTATCPAPTLEAAVAELRALSPTLVAYLAEPMLRVTMAPTTARASEKDNVIPSHAEALVDCRVPPGIGPDEVRARVVELLGPLEGDGRGRVRRRSSATARRRRRRCWRGDRGPGSRSSTPSATLVPIVMPGFSDSHWFRQAFGSATVYGFFPQREMALLEAAPLIHSADERAAVADIELAARLLRRHLPAGARVSGPDSRLERRRLQRRRSGRGPQMLRLGGMALRNGLLIHGPTSWAVAARAADGSIEVASGPKPSARTGRLRIGAAAARPAAARRGARGRPAGAAAARVRSAAVRGPARCSARSVVATGATGALRRTEPAERRPRDARSRLLGALPALAALRDRRPRRLSRGRAQGDRRLRAGQRPGEVPKEHERCGSNLIAPMLALSIAGQVLVERLVDEPGPAAARPPRPLAAGRRRSRCSPIAERHPESAVGGRSTAPGYEIQRRFSTREPSPEQLEVGVGGAGRGPARSARRRAPADTV